MTTVALVGVDGSGKTTVARALTDDESLRVRYLYMGPNIESSNVSLPWSRVVLRLKLASYRREAEREGIDDPSFVSTHHEAHRNVKRGAAMSALRNVNRLLEAVYRQLLSWRYQRNGYVVLYDRHFLFDAASRSKRRPWTERSYEWILRTVFPKPDLVLFLDAPAEVVYARKGEGSVEYLDRKRAVYLSCAPSVPRFVSIDADRPVGDVIAEVKDRLVDA